MGRGEAALAAHGGVLPAPGVFGVNMSRQTPPQLGFSPRSGSGTLTGRWSPWEAAPASASNPVSGSPRPVLREKRSARPLAAGPGTLPPLPGHEGSLTSEPLAQDALQQLAEGHEVRRGVRAGPAALPQPQHPSCGEERERRHPWVPSRGKGRGHSGDSSARPRGGLRHPGTTLPSPAAAAALGRNSAKLPRSQGRAAGLAQGAPARPRRRSGQTGTGARPSAAGRSSHRCRGPTLTFKGAQQRLLPGHGLAVPQGQAVPRRRLDGNRESGIGNGERAPPQERSSPAPRAGETSHTHRCTCT